MAKVGGNNNRMCGVEVEERLSGSLEMTQAGAGRKAARTSPAGDWAPLAGRAGGSWSALPSHPTTPVSPEAPTLELRELAGTDSPTQHSPPQSTDVRGTQEQQQQQPEEGGRGRQHLEHSAAGWCGRGRGCGASRCARGRGLQGERGGGGCGGREAMAPAAAGGAHRGRGGRGGGGERTGQPAPVSPAELAREKKSEPGAGVGGERGPGGGGGQGGRGVAVATVKRRDSRERAVRPGAAGAELCRGRVRGPGAGPESARGCGTRLPCPFPSPLADWEPPAAAQSRGQGGAGKQGGEEWGGGEELGNGGRAGRETFDRFVDCKERKLPRNEGVGGGGSSEGDAGAGAGRGSPPGSLGAPGRGAELDPWTSGPRRGHPLPAPPPRCTPLSQSFLEERRKP